jgi:hypothetical protein
MVSSVNAQWRLGVTAGASYNHYSIDTRYMSGVNYTNAWGESLGFLAQYDIFHWLGIRTDLNWTFKNHKVSMLQNRTDYKAYNSYVQLPIMASFSARCMGLNGFCNLGVYGAYWLSSHKYGTEVILDGDVETLDRYKRTVLLSATSLAIEGALVIPTLPEPWRVSVGAKGISVRRMVGTMVIVR